MSKVIFWGTRGSVATPGATTLRYGGNTSSVEVRSGKDFLILDAGTGIRALGLNRFHRRSGKEISILISHDHMDHIGGLPFFAPALRKGQKIQIYGPPGIKKSLRNLFPFPILKSRRRIRERGPAGWRIPPFVIQSRWSNHPGRTLAYRISTPDHRTIVYISDHEPTARFRHGRSVSPDKALVHWIQGSDLLIMDAQYFEEEYRRCRGWGHSPVSDTVKLALEGGVKRLVLFHHDPAHSDRRLQEKLAQAKKEIARSGRRLFCGLAKEGEVLRL